MPLDHSLLQQSRCENRLAFALSDSLIKYWSRLGPSDRIHPDDRVVWDRLAPTFSPCLPTPYYGRIADAPVVLLFLSPGLSDRDLPEAEDPDAQRRYMRIRAGQEPLATAESWKDLWDWWTPRTRIFGPPEELRHRVAVLNVSAYKSKDFDDHAALAALPSCRATIEWAQRVLFPEAEAGRRVVVCLRASRWWGLTAGKRYGASLYAPLVNRAGHMVKGDGADRDEVILAVRNAVTSRI